MLPGCCLSGGAIVGVVFVFVLVGGAVRSGRMSCDSSYHYEFHRSAAARLLRSCVRIPPGAWIFVRCECRVLSGRALCDELITLSCVVR